jgi:single-stranded-DNA-specific exonuclease
MKDVTMELAKDMARLAPFGTGNPEPLFAARRVTCESIDRIGADKKTLRFMFSDGKNKIRGIAFGMYNIFVEAFETAFGAKATEDWVYGGLREPVVMDIAFHVDINEYNGYTNVQAKIVDVIF